MNMKKTIAAIAAGAVAVSAMATTVSALQDTALTYNLVKTHTVKKAVEGTGSYEFTLQNVAADSTGDIQFTTNFAKETVKSVVIKVASSTAGEQNKIFTYSTSQNDLNYNPKVTAAGLITISNELNGYTGNLTVTVTVNTAHTRDTWEGVSNVNADIAAGTIKATTTIAGADLTPVTLKAFTASSEKEYKYYAPFKTEIKNNQNVTRYLQEQIGYHNVGAVLNDAIENYESVTFTFNTATTGIVWTVENGNEKYFDNVYCRTGEWGADYEGMTRGGDYKAALVNAGGDASKLLALYCGEWFADTSYTSFAQHLYNGTNGVYGNGYITSWESENTGYMGFDWTGYNLFQGALVINENLTMSLAETDYFDWTATSLSFDWDAIMDGAMTSNDYAVYLHSMKLATSNTWYWDNMVVTLTAGAAEDGVDAEAGTEVDDEELTEDPAEEVVEEPAEEPVVENPTTGNAPIALAVIPVALAAAAVVAKKRS